MFPVGDFPTADAGEVCGEDVGGPFVTKHDGVFWFGFVVFHGFGEFGAAWFPSPPHARHIDWLAELLHHFFAAIVTNDDDFDAGLFASFDPFLKLFGRLFFGMKS